MKDDFGYEVPVESVPLPSQGKVYSEDNPLYGQNTVDIRAMTAREEDILTSRALIKKGTVISELLNSCVMTPGVDSGELLAGDRNAIMVALRITGYGRMYSAEIACGSCGERSEADFDLAQLPIKRLDIDPVEDGKNVFEFKLPHTGKTVQFKFLTGDDEQDILQETERKRKTLRHAKDSLVTSRLRRSIISVDGVTDKSKIAVFIANMPAADSRALRKFMEAHEPGVDMKSWTTCELCGHEQEVSMPIGAKFFWPDV
jgi:hypothetical protein